MIPFNDVTRAGFMAIVTSGLSLAVLMGLKIDAHQTAAITLFVNNVMIFGMMAWKNGQGETPKQAAAPELPPKD